MNKFKIALMPGDGIGQEITAPSMKLVSQAAKQLGVELKGETIEAGAQLTAGPEMHFRRKTSGKRLRQMPSTWLPWDCQACVIPTEPR